MKKRNIIFRLLIYLILVLSTFYNLYGIKKTYDSSNSFMQQNAYNIKDTDPITGNFKDLDNISSIQVLMDHYRLYIKNIQFRKDYYGHYMDVYMVDKKKNINIIITYDYYSGVATYKNYEVNCNYWLRITINFVIILVGLIVARKLERKKKI